MTAQSKNTKQPASGKVLVTGSSGMVGSALCKRLAERQQESIPLMRRAESDADLVWDPSADLLDELPEELAAVVHLAGESIAEGRWSKSKMQTIRDSRVQGTRLLSERLARMQKPPAVLVSASAIGYYGDRGEEAQTESDGAGSGFLAEVCEEWEAATRPAAESGIRVVNLRIGVVLASEGGALKKMMLPFKMGLGGRLGKGDQYMSWITLEDLVSVICRSIDDPGLQGPVNATSPNPVTNLEFTKTLGNVIKRPTVAPVPAFMLRTILGSMADSLLLASIRVLPKQLLEQGFVFGQPKLEGALRHILKGKA